MEPVSTCFHYNYPQSIASLIKTTNSEILINITLLPNPMPLDSEAVISFLASSPAPPFPDLSQSRKLEESRQVKKERRKVVGRASVQHLSKNRLCALALPTSPSCSGLCYLLHNLTSGRTNQSPSKYEHTMLLLEHPQALPQAGCPWLSN